MKIILPDDYSEITVGQYKKLWKLYEKEEDAYVAQRRCIELLAKLEEGALKNASWESIEKASGTINWLISEPDPFTLKLPLVRRFRLNDVDYGFIPDWSRLTVGEYAMNIAVAAIVFFCRIEEELISTTQRSLQEMEKAQEMASTKSGGGMASCTSWLKAIF